LVGERLICNASRTPELISDPVEIGYKVDAKVMPKATKGGFYAVRVGKVRGVYNTWYVLLSISKMLNPRG
jgi:hypothetical protein